MARSTQSAIMAGGSKSVKNAEKVKELKDQLKAAEKEVKSGEKSLAIIVKARDKIAAKLLKLTAPKTTPATGIAERIDVMTADKPE